MKQIDSHELIKLSWDMTVKELAAHYGVTVDQIRAHLRRAGIEGKKRNRNHRPINLRKDIYQYYITYGGRATAEHFRMTLVNVKNVVRDYRKNRQRHAAKFTDERLVKLRGAAFRYAKNKSYTASDPDEFAAFVMIKALEGRRIVLDQVYVDYMRKAVADSRSDQYEMKLHEMNASSIDTPGIESKSEDNLIGKSPEDNFISKDLDSIMRLLGVTERYHRAVLILRFVYAFDQREIANIFGVTESRVSQVLSNTIEKIHDRFPDGIPEDLID